MTLPGHLIGFADALRSEGVAIGTSELNDAFAALGEVPWTEPAPFREALAATLAKSQEDRRVFDLVFERYFFRAAEGAAISEGVREGSARSSSFSGRDGGSACVRSICARSSSRRRCASKRRICSRVRPS